jgi:hypothetical protein
MIAKYVVIKIDQWLCTLMNPVPYFERHEETFKRLSKLMQRNKLAEEHATEVIIPALVKSTHELKVDSKQLTSLMTDNALKYLSESINLEEMSKTGDGCLKTLMHVADVLSLSSIDKST